jgi:preprotein translocase subunit SecG
MSAIVVIIHVIVCVALILIVLLQTGKGADMGMVFGGGGSQTLFGASGASTFLGKATTIVAVVFMLTSFSLAYMWGHRTGDSIMSNTEVPVQIPAEQNEQAPSSEAPKAKDEVAPQLSEPTPMPAEQVPMQTQGQESPAAESSVPSAATPESSQLTNN